MLSGLWGKLFGGKGGAAKRGAEDAAGAPAAKKAKNSFVGVAKPKKAAPSGGDLQRVNELRRLRCRQALLFTTSPRSEKKAAHEAWELLQDHAEKLLPAAAAAAAPARAGTLASALAAEAAASTGRVKITMHDIGSAGVCYATVDHAVDVVALATSVFEAARDDPTSPAAGARFIVRLSPLQAVRYGNLEGLLEAAGPLIEKAFGGLARGVGSALLEAETARAAEAAAKPASKKAAKRAVKAAKEAAEKDAEKEEGGDDGDAEDEFDDDPVAKATARAEAEDAPDAGNATPLTYRVALKRRNADAFPKDIAIHALASLVPKQHTVNLGSPDVTIVVEVYKSLIGVGVVPGYAKHHNFNLHAATGKQARPAPGAGKKGGPKEVPKGGPGPNKGPKKARK